MRVISASAAVSARRTGTPFEALANPPTGVYVTPKRQTRDPLLTWPPFAWCPDRPLQTTVSMRQDYGLANNG